MKKSVLGRTDFLESEKMSAFIPNTRRRQKTHRFFVYALRFYCYSAAVEFDSRAFRKTTFYSDETEPFPLLKPP